MTLAIPTIHMNGTSRDDLLEGLCEAIRALNEAGRKLAAACPNGRDYYQSPGAIGIALDQHQDRLLALQSITKELETIAEAISQ